MAEEEYNGPHIVTTAYKKYKLQYLEDTRRIKYKRTLLMKPKITVWNNTNCTCNVQTCKERTWESGSQGEDETIPIQLGNCWQDYNTK